MAELPKVLCSVLSGFEDSLESGRWVVALCMSPSASPSPCSALCSVQRGVERK